MRSLVIFFLLIPFIWSCSKQDETKTPIDVSTLKFTKYDQILKSIPLDIFKNNSKAIFKNELGFEKTMSINVSEGFQKQNVNGQNITIPKYNVNYYESTEPKYALYFYVSPSIIDDNGNHNAHLTASIFTNLISFVPFISFDHVGNPAMCRFSNNLTLLDKTFDSVFSSIPLDGIDILSEIHFTASSGVVSFNDEQNEQWVLDRFEK